MIRYDYSQPYVTRDEYLEVKGVDLNIELQDDDNVSNKVNRFIQDLTNYVLDHLVMEYGCNELNRQLYDFEDLAEFRRVRFHYGMLDQIEYVLNNGLIQLNSGINMETGSITDFSAVVIGPAALRQFKLAGFCNKQEKSICKSDLSPKDMPTIEELVLELGKKVDKVDGKGLSANNYSDSEKMKLNQVVADLDGKVDKEAGKSLTSNDFTNAYKQKLDSVQDNAQVNVIEEIAIDNIPVTVSGKRVNIPVLDRMAEKENVANKVTSINEESTDIQYPSAKAVYTALQILLQIAEGKTTAYSIDPTEEGNETFQSNDSTITVASFVDVNGNTVNVSDLKKGDLVFTLNGVSTKYADRWLIDPATGAWGLIDADTPDLAGYVTLNTAQSITATKGFTDFSLIYDNTNAKSLAGYLGDKADKVSGAVNDDLASLNSDGNLVDSGIAKSDVALKSGNNAFSGNNTFNGWAIFNGQVAFENTIDANLIPSADESFTVGSASNAYSRVYSYQFTLKGSYHSWNMTSDASGSYWQVDRDGSNKLRIYSNEILFNVVKIRGSGDNYTDIGDSTHRIKDLYLSGNISDGTNSISVANISSKSYAEGLVARSNLVTILGEASQQLNGLMSATDKTRLDTLFALLGETSDSDTVVNTINEVLAIFSQYPEGADLVSALSGKVDKVQGKGLSTNDYDDTEKGNVASNTSARHTHSNKALLDTYTQTEVDIADAVSKKHSHSNKSLLDTYTQTETNLADAVSKKHEHSNKSVLDDITAAYTTAEATKLSGIATGAQVNVIETIKVNGTAQTVSNKAVDISIPLISAEDYTIQ